MLNIKKTIQNDAVTFELEGRLNIVETPALQAAVDEVIGDAPAIVFDFKKLEYLSSAGLRILLTTQQDMEETGRPDVTVQGANADILGVFAVTGFDSVLNIK
ncbi:MAG: STAS domain-containing protein [Ruminococcus sp.]|nr:STAS domain-containing protein [Ruminococcus sp.]